MDEQKKIYIVMSQPGTWICRLLRQFTRQEFNHVSISLQKDLGQMYSFGRKTLYFPFWGGFITESKEKGVFKRFPQTQIQVLALTVSAEKYQQIYHRLQQMVEDRERYHYNYWGVVFGAFHLQVEGTNRYYCSEFVRNLLQEYGVEGAEVLKSVVHPSHFGSIPGAETVYRGPLQDFSLC